MTLQSSGPISAQNINVELGRAAGAAFSLGGAAERALAGVPSGAISFSNFYGKSNSVAVSYESTAQNVNASSSYSFSAMDIGAAAADRRVFITVSWAGDDFPEQIASATIGGIAATIHKQQTLSDSVSQSIGCAILSAVVPTGTTATVVINFTDVAEMCAVGTFRTTGFSAITEALSDTDQNNPVQVVTVAIDIGANGAVIAVATNSFDAGDIVWTAGATERYEGVDSGGNDYEKSRWGAAMSSGLGVQANRPITAQDNTGNSAMVLVAVSFT